MSLRFFFGATLFALFHAGCSTTAPGTADTGSGALDGGPGVDAAALDVGLALDATSVDGSVDGATVDAPAVDTRPSCSCRSGAYRATGTGSGFSVDYVFDLAECGGAPVCHVGHTADTLVSTPCMMTPDGVFRVYLDGAGYVQLVFSTTPCDAPWTGLYATEGGSASVTATRL